MDFERVPQYLIADFRMVYTYFHINIFRGISVTFRERLSSFLRVLVFFCIFDTLNGTAQKVFIWSLKRHNSVLPQLMTIVVVGLDGCTVSL